uniref:Subtilisin-like protease n=2 Tax=Oryza meridionalis TaxID=40149 RepID=A0A0E0CS79_9ORYZ
MGKPLVVTLLLCSSLLAVAAAAASPPSSTAAGHAGEPDDDVVSTYIVHVMPPHAPRRLPTHRASRRLTRAYASLVRGLLPRHIADPAPRLLYSYAHAETGFVARLTARQAAHLEAQPSIAAVAESNGAVDAVIGVIDTGIYPKDRASFAPDHLCLQHRLLPSVLRVVVSASAYCNNKLVGAKTFYRGYEAEHGPIDERMQTKSPLDTIGHGTHTSSTAAGHAVPNANLFGLTNGIAKGTAPGARIAMYKVCWEYPIPECITTDILAALDEAIADGVDVISISLGSPGETILSEPTSTAGFNAVRKGIVVVGSAGNDGTKYPVCNIAPWVLTVGASSMNRQFPGIVVLGNDQTFFGTSLYPGNTHDSLKPLVHGYSAGSPYCVIGKLISKIVAGKIVLCEAGGEVQDVEKGVVVDMAGGYGAIIRGISNVDEYLITTAHLVPATKVSHADGEQILQYMNTVPYPVGKILFYGTVVGSTSPSAPRVVRRRGSAVDPRRVKFNIISGTSMSCPHVSGIAALLKKARPSWSPEMIMSALMTTAYGTDSAGDDIKDMATGMAAGPFDLGAGHVDPNRALDPGLVYDAGMDDYLDFLCGLGYSQKQIDGIFTKDGSVTNCSTRERAGAANLNRPSFSVFAGAYGESVILRRTVRNVGSNVNAVYTFRLSSPPGTEVSVSPGKLVFDATHQTRTYRIRIQSTAPYGVFTRYTYGWIAWSDGVHRVRSPIAVSWPSQSAAVSTM